MSETLDLSGTGAAYIRVSTDQQDTTRQYAAIESFERRHGVSIPRQHVYKDEGWARDEADRRPEFQRLFKLAEAGSVQWILVDQLDRFGTKNPKQLMHYLYRLEEAGCKLYDASGREWTGEDIGTTIVAVVEGEKSKGEQTSKSHRVLGGKIAKARLGEWQGGPIRLGFDLVCFHRETGQELWRVVFEGVDVEKAQERKRRIDAGDYAGGKRPPMPLLRLKVFPDGRTERFDGEGNLPRCQPMTEVLRVYPSNDKTKIAAAVNVFGRYATESVTFVELAHQLNKLGFRNVYGTPFHGHHVARMLEDPIYLGYYSYNKQHHGKFHKWEDGTQVLEPNYEGKVTANQKKDWVLSHRLFESLVGLETWNAVQAKLECRTPQTRAPRSPGLYLSGMLYCGNCGGRMVAGPSRKNQKRERFEFMCGTYHSANVTGQREGCTCLRNGIYQDELEPFIERYLEETGRRLEILTRPPDVGALTGRLEEKEATAWHGFRDGIARLARYIMKHRPEEYLTLLRRDAVQHAEDVANMGEDAPAGTLAEKLGSRGRLAWERAQRSTEPPPVEDFVAAILSSYRANFDGEGLADEIKQVEAEHTRLVEGWIDLPTKAAKEKAKARLTQLEERIDELKKQAGEGADKVEACYREMLALQIAIADARLSLSDGNQPRRRAAALRKAIQRIECKFTATGKKGGGPGRRNTALATVTIYPTLGDPAEYRADSVISGNRVQTLIPYITFERLLTLTFAAA